MSNQLLRLLAAAAALALVLGACSDGQAPEEAGDEAGEAAGEADEAAGELETPAEGDFPEPQELDDPDLAATVGGTEIPVETVEQRFEQLSGSPAVTQQLEQEDGEKRLRAQLLTHEILTIVLVEGAEEEGIEITEADEAETREQIVEEFGGEEELQTFLEESGQSMADLDAQLRGQTALRLLTEQLAPEAADAGPDDQQAQMQGQMAVQQWLQERLTSVEIAVNPDFGTWNPQMGQILPPGMTPEDLQQPPPQDFGGEADQGGPGADGEAGGPGAGGADGGGESGGQDDSGSGDEAEADGEADDVDSDDADG